MRKSWFSLVIFLLALFPCYSQSNDDIDAFIKKERADFGTAAFFALTASGKMVLEEETDYADIEEAMEYIKTKKWFSKMPASDSYISAGDASLLMLRAFDINGGIMYKITKDPRYALREMQYRSFLSKNLSNKSDISGGDFLTALSNVAIWHDERRNK